MARTFRPGYGWAGYNELTGRVEVMPLGLNYLYSMVMWLYYEVVEGCQSRAQSYTYKTGHQLGAFAGYQKGYMEGYADRGNGTPNKVLETMKNATERDRRIAGSASLRKCLLCSWTHEATTH